MNSPEQIREVLLVALDSHKHVQLWDHLRTGGTAAIGRDQELQLYGADGSGPVTLR